MKTVSRQEIEEAWDRLCDLGEEETGALVKRFMEEQPALGIYVSASFESLEEDSETPLIELIIASWQAMSQAAGNPLQQVSPEEIDNAEQANTSALEGLEDAAEMEWEDAVLGLVQNYNQRELLGFGVEMLMTGNEDAPELAPDSLGLELIWYKTVLDCLDQAGGPATDL